MATESLWENLPKPIPDPVFLLDSLAKQAVDPKINLVIGAYRDERGLPRVLDVVRKAERMLVEDQTLNKEYLPIDGLLPYRKASERLVFGPDLHQKIASRVASAQALSGTGACCVLAFFYARTLPHQAATHVYIPNPTWANHVNIFKLAGFTNIFQYRYFDKATNGVAIREMLSDLEKAKEHSIVLLHLCAHNPTGADPTREEWVEIAKLCLRKKLVVMFDSAYQGYASGNLDHDAYAARLFVKMGLEISIAQSYAKNLGLYNERVGTSMIVCASPKAANLVQGVLKNVIRPMYSNPPSHGARIVCKVLTDKGLFEAWMVELKGMANRIIKMRKILYDELVHLGTPGNWEHITKQIGMFSYTGLNPAQCEEMIRRRVFMLRSGRISVAGLTENTAKLMAKHMDEVVRMIPAKVSKI